MVKRFVLLGLLVIALIALVFVCLPAPVSAQAYTIAPPPFLTAFDNSGKIINGACVWTYLAGTSTPATTYSTNAGVANSNPIQADSAGRFTVYLVAGTAYKFVYESACTPPAHGTTLRTADNIVGTPSSSATVDITVTAGETISAGLCAYVSDGSGGKVSGQAYKCDSANTYSSTTSVVGLVPAAITSGATGSLRILGTVTGLSTSVGSTYYVGSAGAITVTAPANKRLLGVADTATSLIVTADPRPLPASAGSTGQVLSSNGATSDPSFVNQIATVTSNATGNQNGAWFTLPARNTVLYLTNASTLNVQSIPAGFDGQELTLISQGAGQVDLANNSASGTAGQKLQNFATGADVKTSLAAGVGTAKFVFDATNTRWNMVLHEQGAWITRTFAAGNFTANGAMTWTVTSGETSRDSYYLKGKTLTYAITVVASTAGGVANTALQIAIPGGFTSSASTQRMPIAITNNGVGSIGMISVGSSATLMQVFLDTVGGTNWTLSANTSVEGVFSFEVQ